MEITKTQKKIEKVTNKTHLEGHREEKIGSPNLRYSICKVCNNEFNNRNNLYCSNKCKEEHNKKKLYLRGKSRGYALGLVEDCCKQCGKMFKKKTKNHVFCSVGCCQYSKELKIERFCSCGEKINEKRMRYCSKCVSDLRIKRVLKKKVNKNCQHCNIEMNPQDIKQKFCSPYCRQQFYYKNKKKSYYKDKNIQKNCQHCKKLFILKTPNNLFCSKECSKIHNHNKYRKLSLKFIEGDYEDPTPYLKLRFEILKRDNFMCQYCGRSPRKNKCRLQIDHIIPKAKGGGDDINNLITSCEECNQGKKDILLEERQLQKLNIIKVENE